MPPIETEPIDSDSDDGVHFDDGPPPEAPSRTPPRHHHHHRSRHHRHHQNHHRDENDDVNDDDVSEIERDRDSKEKMSSPSSHQSQPSGNQSMPVNHDEDSRMSLVSEPEKSSGGNFVPFAMGGGGPKGGADHPSGNKTPASPGSASNQNQQLVNIPKKKGRIDVKDVFNNDDDDDGTNNTKKRKLVPLGEIILDR